MSQAYSTISYDLNLDMSIFCGFVDFRVFGLFLVNPQDPVSYFRVLGGGGGGGVQSRSHSNRILSPKYMSILLPSVIRVLPLRTRSNQCRMTLCDAFIQFMEHPLCDAFIQFMEHHPDPVLQFTARYCATNPCSSCFHTNTTMNIIRQCVCVCVICKPILAFESYTFS